MIMLLLLADVSKRPTLASTTRRRRYAPPAPPAPPARAYIASAFCISSSSSR